MASSSLSDAQAELIKSIPPEDIPAKLRCAICSKLAVNTFRLPCCDQVICDSCQAALPSSCPVCEHSPLSADDCLAQKNLRTTIKIFLRTWEKKRETERSKESTPSTPVETAHPAPAPLVSTATVPPEPTTAGQPETIGGEKVEEASTQKEGVAGEQANASPEVPAGSTDQPANGIPPESAAEAPNKADLASIPGDGEPRQDVAQNVPSEENEVNGQMQPNQGFNAAFGFGNMGGGFPNMNMVNGNSSLDPMQMMMAMQNGMIPNNFGNFPMMGMPNVDPMTMQMMNGGFQGMGMNGMNMNMGMGGFGGEANNNWNGQQSWNVGQDNYSHPNASGMGNGDYGPFNPGFQTGYNQGNFGHQDQYNDYRRGQFGFRGRGRGRGFHNSQGYGRGGWHSGRDGNFGNHQNSFQGQSHEDHQQYSTDSGGYGQGGPAENTSGDVQAVNNDANVDEFGRELRPEPAQGDVAGAGTEQPNHDVAGASDQDATQGEKMGSEKPTAPTSAPSPAASKGDEAAMSGSVAGDSEATRLQTPVLDVPINAPKGPKAMLQGLPNKSIKYLQACGLVETTPTPSLDDKVKDVGSVDRQSERAPSRSRSSVRGDAEKAATYGEDEGKEPERRKDDGSRDVAERERGRERDDWSPSRPRSSSRDRSYRESRPYKRHRSTSMSDGGDDAGHRRGRQSRKHSIVDDDFKIRRDDSYRESRPHKRLRSTSILDEGDDAGHRHGRQRRKHSIVEDTKTREMRDEEYDDRSRSPPPNDSRRPTHRGGGRRKRRARDREHEVDDAHRRSSHRSPHGRDDDRLENDGDRQQKTRRERRRDKNRERRGERGRESDRRRDGKVSKEIAVAATSSDRDFRPPPGPRKSGGTATATGGRGLEIKGTGSMAQDIHAQERAARDRERLLKETRRMASLTNMTGVKRGRDEGDDEGRRRRKARRGDVMGGDEEERMRRLEREREQARYD